VSSNLLALEIPKDSIVKYETALQTAEILLITHETAAEVYKDIIESTHTAPTRSCSGVGIRIGPAVRRDIKCLRENYACE
jgi:hypothetical protein